MQYLVTATGGPAFAAPQEMIDLLEKIIIPHLDALIDLERSQTIMAGGLPVGERAFVLIAEASSNEELDMKLRRLPAWAILEWEVTPLQSIAGRADQAPDCRRPEGGVAWSARPLLWKAA